MLPHGSLELGWSCDLSPFQRRIESPGAEPRESPNPNTFFFGKLACIALF